MSSGREALRVLEQLRPRFHPDPAEVDGALENQFAAGPREIRGAGGASYAISNPVLQYIADLPASDWTSVESGCGYSTVVLANTFGTHICVNPDLASNRLVREFVAQHSGTTGLRHIEQSSDQGLPGLVAEGARVDLALIDGNHSHPFPLLDFHYMDLMLAPGGRLLIDNTEIEAVQELTGYLEVEAAYDLERLIGNCAVYRKVRDRAFGWKSQVLRRAPGDAQAARRELTQLRMEVTPDLRAALTGGGPLPEPADASTSRRAPSPTLGALSGAGRIGSRFSRRALMRPVRHLVRWYATPSGLLAGVGLVLLALGIALPDLWRLIGVAGVCLIAVFLPYKFLREQRRTDQRLAVLGRDTARRVDAQIERRLATVAESTRALDERITTISEHVSHELAAVHDGVAHRIDEFEARLAPSRRFAATKHPEPRLLELTMRDATEALRQAPPDSAE
jgi:hypothetical protein